MTVPPTGLRSFVHLLISASLVSCSVLQESNRSTLKDGYYTMKEEGNHTSIYLQVEEDSLSIYESSSSTPVEPYPSSIVHLGKNEHSQTPTSRFLTSSLDIDLLTIPLKYRFSAKDVQPQLNTEIVGVLYLGYRTDRYKLKHAVDPLHKKATRISHYGYSFGVFSGFGNTFMSPTTTFNRTEQEYDGIVWSNGVAAILGFNNLSVGLALGFDRLMDENSNIWIYQDKPWIGFTLGLNLY